MTATLLGTWPVESPEWYAARQNCLGGSEIAAVLGLSKWDSPFSLWHRKAGRIPDKLQNEEMRAGRFLEDGISSSFADRHPDRVVMPAGTYANAARPWQIANPDRLIYPEGTCQGTACDCRDYEYKPVAILETKLALYPDEWGDEGTDEIPPYYLAQCRWYLDVFEPIETCYVHVFIGALGEFRTYVIKSDPDDQRYMREEGRRFLDSIERGERPPLDSHTATYQAVRRLHPGIEDIDVELDENTAQTYIAGLREFASAERYKSKACARVLAAIGDGRRATYQGKTIAIRVPGRGDAGPFLRPARGLLKETS